MTSRRSGGPGVLGSTPPPVLRVVGLSWWGGAGHLKGVSGLMGPPCPGSGASLRRRSPRSVRCASWSLAVFDAAPSGRSHWHRHLHPAPPSEPTSTLRPRPPLRVRRRLHCRRSLCCHPVGVASTAAGTLLCTCEKRASSRHTNQNVLGYHVRVAVSIPGSYAGLLGEIGHLVASLCHIFT